MITVDTRGKGEQEIANILTKMGCKVSNVPLIVGDYMIGNLIVERKSWRDLTTSALTQSKHLWLQCQRLRDSNMKPLFIIEGKKQGLDVEDGIIRAIVASYNIPVVYTKNKFETAKFLQELHVHYGVEREVVPLVTVIKSHTPEEVRHQMLCTVKGIGTATAKRILQECPQLFENECLVHADTIVEKLTRIPRLTKSSIELLMESMFTVKVTVNE